MTMNLRTLKKLSKRAAPILAALGDCRKQFPAEPDDCYTSRLISARKHWERSTCHASYEGRNNYSISRGAERVFKTRAGRTVVMRPPSHPRKGTIMVGAMSGYYEPEWDEETAWEALDSLVRNHFCDWSEDGPTPTRSIKTPAELFRAADDMTRELHA